MAAGAVAAAVTVLLGHHERLQAVHYFAVQRVDGVFAFEKRFCGLRRGDLFVKLVEPRFYGIQKQRVGFFFSSAIYAAFAAI